MPNGEYPFTATMTITDYCLYVDTHIKSIPIAFNVKNSLSCATCTMKQNYMSRNACFTAKYNTPNLTWLFRLTITFTLT